MLIEIIRHTPSWVFVLFVGLVALGLSQSRDRTASQRRVLAMPLAMGGLAAFGVLSAFGQTGLTLGLACLLVFLKMLAATAWVVSRRPAAPGSRYDDWQRVYHLPGSLVPLALIMGIFLTKYAVGVALALHPELAARASVALPISAVYGLFSGVFAGRAIQLARLARSAPGRPGLGLA